MEGMYTSKSKEFSIIQVFVKSRTYDIKKGIYGFSIDIDCCDVFLTDVIKEQVEKLATFVLSCAPEIQVYRYIKYKEPLIEFKASQLVSGNYKIAVSTLFEEQLRNIDNYSEIISLISKDIVERISYLFGAYSLDNY